MTGKRQRKINRANSAAGLLRQVQAEKKMTSPLDAATWHPRTGSLPGTLWCGTAGQNRGGSGNGLNGRPRQSRRSEAGSSYHSCRP